MGRMLFFGRMGCIFNSGGGGVMPLKQVLKNAFILCIVRSHYSRLHLKNEHRQSEDLFAFNLCQVCCARELIDVLQDGLKAEAY